MHLYREQMVLDHPHDVYCSLYWISKDGSGTKVRLSFYDLISITYGVSEMRKRRISGMKDLVTKYN